MNNLPILKYIKKFPLSFTLQGAGGILYNTLAAYTIILLGRVIDAAVSEDFSATLKAVVFYISIIFLCQLGRYIKRYYVSDFSLLMEMDMKKDIFNSIISKQMSALEHDKVGDLISRTTIDVTRVTAAVSKTIEEVWDTWLLLASYLVSLLLINWRITLISSVFIPFSILTAELIRHPLDKHSKRYSSLSGKISTQLQQTISGVHILRLFGAEEQKKGKLNEQCEKQAAASLMMTILQSAMMPLYVAVASIGVIVIIISGGKEVLSGAWKIGTFWSFLTIFTAMAARTTVAAKVFNMWHIADAAWKRIGEEVVTPASFNSQAVKSSESANVEVSHMGYKYPLGTAPAIKDISFSVGIGEVLGVTGSVGSGKTALCLALCGKYEYEGNIVINGKELRHMGEEERTSVVAYLGHEQFLFSGSVKDNIIINIAGDDVETDEKLLKEALHISCLEYDIKNMENGINTIIGERGAKVSGGQKQRIALARTIYSKRPLLLLDDPFSALDILTEKKIIERLKLLTNKTIIIFSHRLAAFENADSIIVMQGGRIAEHGTHHELIESGGIYGQIYNAQNFGEGVQDEDR